MSSGRQGAHVGGQANFAGEALYKQHLEGPIHRKAVAKEEAKRQRDLQLGAHRDAAASAVVRSLRECMLLMLEPSQCGGGAAPILSSTVHSAQGD
jgi:hypothetical protein